MRPIPTDNLTYSLNLILSNGSSGSGYLVNTIDKIFLVSAKHVVSNPDGTAFTGTARIIGHSANLNDDDQIEYAFDFAKLNETSNVKFHSTEDIVVIYCGSRESDGLTSFVNGIRITKKPTGRCIGVAFKHIKIFQDVGVSNSVFIQGYPSSIGLKVLPQIDYQKPLVRRGIVAAKNKKQNTIILDCPVFPGNSGGPVIEAVEDNLGIHFKVIGTIIQRIPMATNLISNSVPDGVVIYNSGYSVVNPMDSVIEMISNWGN